MLLRREFNKLNSKQKTAIVIGNFDGVHKGHKCLIEQMLKKAKENNLRPTLYTFNPHPKKLFLGENGPKIITSLAIKACLLKEMGVDLLIVRPFTKKFAETSFSDFIYHLKEDLNVGLVVIGEDFSFGKNREGNAEKLKEYGEKLGFDTIMVNDILCSKNERFSSSRIREKLKNGDVKVASELLGRYFNVNAFLYEDDYCNLVADFSRYTKIKNAVYLAKIKYNNEMQIPSCVVPLKIIENKGYIPPLPDMPDLPLGKVNLSLIEKIED